MHLKHLFRAVFRVLLVKTNFKSYADDTETEDASVSGQEDLNDLYDILEWAKFYNFKFILHCHFRIEYQRKVAEELGSPQVPKSTPPVAGIATRRLLVGLSSQKSAVAAAAEPKEIETVPFPSTSANENGNPYTPTKETIMEESFQVTCGRCKEECRKIQRRMHGQSPSITLIQELISDNNKKEELIETIEGGHNTLSSSLVIKDVRESSVGNKDIELEDTGTADGSSKLEGCIRMYNLISQTCYAERPFVFGKRSA
ncbi:hypothetical protein RJT34_12795 [Clitoria ternatea]|uniref:Uncharacterized protein n=1 Tax=Clitoria ternatea TaxID=43366 RepID=A0AAN9JQ30_CLITE